MPRLLHTADWHLGKRLHDFRLLDEQHEALGHVLAVVDAEAPDLVVVAGDVFDVPVPPLGALELWEWFCRSLLDDRGVPLVAIPGNHDQAERLAMNARVARRAGLHVLHDLGTAHEPVRVNGIDVFAIPFHKPPRARAIAATVEPANPAQDEQATSWDDVDYDAAMAWILARARRSRDPAVPSVLVAHAFVAGGHAEDEGEEPLMVGGAGAVAAPTLAGFDYVALGHLHTAHAVGGLASVRYAGSLFPYAFGEANAKSVTVVDLPVAGDGAVQVRPVGLPNSRQVRVVEGVTFERALQTGLDLRARDDPRADDYLLVRVDDRAPIVHAMARLREVYPRALLEQPVVDVPASARRLPGDPRTISVEDAFLAFYDHVFGEPPSALERELLRDALASDGADAEVSG